MQVPLNVLLAKKENIQLKIYQDAINALQGHFQKLVHLGVQYAQLAHIPKKDLAFAPYALGELILAKNHLNALLVLQEAFLIAILAVAIYVLVELIRLKVQAFALYVIRDIIPQQILQHIISALQELIL